MGTYILSTDAQIGYSIYNEILSARVSEHYCSDIISIYGDAHSQWESAEKTEEILLHSMGARSDDILIYARLIIPKGTGAFSKL